MCSGALPLDGSVKYITFSCYYSQMIVSRIEQKSQEEFQSNKQIQIVEL